MALSYEEIECVICNESLVDPRPLPCGHSYCGPPRDCLNVLKNNVGGIRCAVCRIDYNLKSTDIKPLYGIRECFQGCSRVKTPSLPCSAHENVECTFWCNSCNVMICASCFEDQHDGHSMRALKKYLVGKIESQFGHPFSERIVEYRQNLRKYMASTASKLAELKLQVQKLENEYSVAATNELIIEEYSKNLVNGAFHRDLNEMTLLKKISELNLLEINIFAFSENSESVTVSAQTENIALKSVLAQTESVMRSPASTQTENVEHSRSVSCTQKEFASNSSITPRTFPNRYAYKVSRCNCVLKHKLADLNLQMEQLEKEVSGAQKPNCFIDEYCKLLSKDTVKKNVNETTLLLRISELAQEILRKMSMSTQTENDAYSISLGSTAQNEGPSSSSSPFKENFSPWIISYDRLCEKNEFDPSNDEIRDCDCILYSVVKEPFWDIPIAITSSLNIDQRYPRCIVRNDSYLHVCPFKFRITADVVKHKFKRNEQMFKVIVECSHLHDYDELLPPSSFRYGLTLHSTEGKYTKKKDGKWEFPKFKDLYWYSITYSELLKPNNGWIDSDDDVSITLQLKRLN